MARLRTESRPPFQRTAHILGALITALDTYQGHVEECMACDMELCEEAINLWKAFNHEAGRARALVYSLSRAPVRLKKNQSTSRRNYG